MQKIKSKAIISNINLDKPLFNFLSPFANDTFNTLLEKDIQQLIFLLNNYYLEYRQKLGFSKENTFGTEIEFIQRRLWILQTSSFNQKKEKIVNETKQTNWMLGEDSSLAPRGLEISSPILKDTQITWQRLERICAYLNKIGYVNEKCGGHIHVGTHILGTDFQAWDNFIKIWIIYEKIILRFFTGEYINLRPEYDKWASPIAELMLESYHRCNQMFDKQFNSTFLMNFFHLMGFRCQAINFQNIKTFTSFRKNNTIEFRCPNGTLNPIIWQNNINLILNLLTSVKNKNFNTELLNQRFTSLGISQIYNHSNYNMLDLPLALEFCDLVFDNNLDKLYFLKQYLKNLQYDNKRFKKSPSLTKKGFSKKH